MARRSLQEEILEAFLIALHEADYFLKKGGPLAPEDHDTQIRKDTKDTRSRGGFSRNPKSRLLRRAILKQVQNAKKACRAPSAPAAPCFFVSRFIGLLESLSMSVSGCSMFTPLKSTPLRFVSL